MSRRTVTLKIDLPIDLVETLAEHGDVLIAAIDALIRDARRVSNSGEIADLMRRIAAKADARHAFIFALGRHAHRLYRARLKNKPNALSPADQKDWRVAMQAEIAAELGQPLEVVEVALRQHRSFMKARIHERRELYAVRAGLRGEIRSETAARFGVGVTTITGLVNQANRQASKKGISLAEYERQLTDARLAQIQASQSVDKNSEDIIDFRAVRITRESAS